MSDLQATVKALTEEQHLVKQELDAATNARNFQEIARWASRMGEIENRLNPLRAHLSDTELTSDEQELVRAEEAARQAEMDFDAACKKREMERRKLEDEIAVQLAPFQQAAEEALLRKRLARDAASQARGRVSEARRAEVTHFVAHRQTG